MMFLSIVIDDIMIMRTEHCKFETRLGSSNPNPKVGAGSRNTSS